MGNQILACHDLAADLGYAVLDSHVYVDEGNSPRLSGRPRLRALLEEYVESGIEAILVWDQGIPDNVRGSLLASIKATGIPAFLVSCAPPDGGKGGCA